MFLMRETGGTKKKGKQATKGEAQVVKENVETIEYYKKILAIANGVFLGVHVLSYVFTSKYSIASLILFILSSIAGWFVWSFMHQIGTKKSGGSVTDLNLEGSISEYAKDVILVVAFTQLTSLLHRYFWWFFLAIPLYAVYKAIMLFFFSPYAQLRNAANSDQDDQEDGKKGPKRKIVRVARH